MTQIPLNLISAKSLEKQLKVVEGRIGELQTEIAELEKIKNACLVLMGGTSPAVAESEEAMVAKAKKKKTDAPVDADLMARVDGESLQEEPVAAAH